jgi:Zn finger protein HypA/HybF involved in hydrogenase expression
MYTLHCPNCQEEFEDEPFDEGNCPGCNEPYSWTDEYIELEDYSDSWIIPYWINY